MTEEPKNEKQKNWIWRITWWGWLLIAVASYIIAITVFPLAKIVSLIAWPSGILLGIKKFVDKDKES